MDDLAIAYVDITIPNERGVMLTLADGEKVVVGNEKREVIGPAIADTDEWERER